MNCGLSDEQLCKRIIITRNAMEVTDRVMGRTKFGVGKPGRHKRHEQECAIIEELLLLRARVGELEKALDERRRRDEISEHIRRSAADLGISETTARRAALGKEE